MLRKLVKLFRECDASLVEVNPLIVTKEGHIVALDAKINIEATRCSASRGSPRCATPHRKTSASGEHESTT